MFRVFPTEPEAESFCATLDVLAGLPKCDHDSRLGGGTYPACTCDHDAGVFNPACPYVTLHVSEPRALADGQFAVYVPEEYREQGETYVEYGALVWPGE